MFLYSINDKCGWISNCNTSTGNFPVTWKSLDVVRDVNSLEDFEQKLLLLQGVVPLVTHSPFLTIYSEAL